MKVLRKKKSRIDILEDRIKKLEAFSLFVINMETERLKKEIAKTYTPVPLCFKPNLFGPDCTIHCTDNIFK